MQPQLYKSDNYTTYDTVISEYLNTGIANQYFLGLLECTECEHTEERNGENDLSLTVPADSLLVKDIVPGNLIVAKVPVAGITNEQYGGIIADQFFKIYNVERNLDTISVQAHHISYELSFKPVNMFTGASDTDPSVALNSLFSNTPNCPFTYRLLGDWTGGESHTFSVTYPGSLRKWLGGVEGSIIDNWPGEIYWDNLRVDYYKSRGSEKVKRIIYGFNLSEFNHVIFSDDYYLNAVAFAEKDGAYAVARTTNTPVNNGTRWAVLDFTEDFSEQTTLPTSYQLITKANQYIRNNNKNILDVSLDVNYAPSKMLIDEPIFLCDTVNIQFSKYGINTNLKVVKVVYDVLREKNISIELNQPKKTLADTVANLQKSQQEYSGAVASANANRAAAQAANILMGND